MKRLKLIGWMLPPLVLLILHWKYTAPFFWSHQSSVAADMAIGPFVLLGFWFFFAGIHAAARWSCK